MRGVYPRLRGLLVNRVAKQRLPGGDDLTDNLIGPPLSGGRRRGSHFSPPAAKLNLGSPDDPHRVINGGRKVKDGATAAERMSRICGLSNF